MTPRAPATLMVVGDVHRFWRAFDADFLARENPALTMFVGDLGDEDVEITKTLAALTLPKVVMLGNHDAWQSFQKRKATPKLREILAVLGTDHLAYEVREVPEAGISVIGARPFSWGGPSLRSPELYEELYGVHTHRSSAAKIVEAARRAEHRDLIILAHNGPLGLSQDAHDIYGKDFGKPGGDWGDRDLALALQRIEDLGMRVQMVIAGHMHNSLVHPRGEQRVRFCRLHDTMYLNPAVVPRVREGTLGSESYFVRTKWLDGKCVDVEEIWADARGMVRHAAKAPFMELGHDREPFAEEEETEE
ncbi:MAG: TIGR04168 family protein [Planctomycetota bacterium]